MSLSPGGRLLPLREGTADGDIGGYPVLRTTPELGQLGLPLQCCATI